jgi:hypothetical protein
MEMSLEIPQKIKNRTTIQSCYITLGMCIPMFTSSQFRIAKLWHHQPRRSPTNKQIKTMWYTYAKEYYSAIKKNKITWFAGKWMELEIIMLSQTHENKFCMFSLICSM